MTLLRKGSRGSGVSELQKLLEAAGYSPGKIDGIFGPKTEAALKAYQQANDLDVDGVYGPKSYASLTGKSDAGEGVEDGDTSPIGDTQLNSVAGDPFVWKVGDKVYLIHETTATDGSTLQLAWEVSPDHVEGLFGPGVTPTYDQTLDALPDEVLYFGNADELANLTEDPITTWRNTLDVESKTQPWLLDPDYQALSLMAVLENRPLSEAEIQQTEWWTSNTASQRAWMKLYHSDPMTAQQRIDDGRILAADALAAAGIDDAPDDVVQFMSDQLITGEWSQTYFQNQVKALSDPTSGFTIDDGLKGIVGESTIDTTQQYEMEVRDTVQRWLGPNFGGWEDDTIAQWAGELRNDPDAMTNLVETLKDQRQALFPDYDRNATYDTIASPWRQFVRNQWGEMPDEADPLFHSIINMNDAAEAGKVLTKEGLARGNQTVENRVSTDLMRSFGGTAR